MNRPWFHLPRQAKLGFPISDNHSHVAGWLEASRTRSWEYPALLLKRECLGATRRGPGRQNPNLMAAGEAGGEGEGALIQP